MCFAPPIIRGILMRVVVDARSGAIRAVNRIVPGPSGYGPVGMMPGPYGAPPPYYRRAAYYGYPMASRRRMACLQVTKCLPTPSPTWAGGLTRRT